MQKKKRNQVNESSWLTGCQLVEFKLNRAKQISVTLCHKSVKSFISEKSKSMYLYTVLIAKEKE